MLRIKKIKSFFQILGEAGVRATFLYGLDQVLRTLRLGTAHRYLFFSQPLTETTNPRLLARNLTCRELQGDDYSRLSEPQNVISYRLAQNGIAVGAFRNDTLIGVIWYTLGGYIEDEVRAVYRPIPEGQAAWDFGVQIVPEYRLGRTFFTLWSAATESMRTRGCHYTLSRINASNTASVRAHRRLGAVPIGHASFVTIGSWQIACCTHSPRIHVSLSPESRPSYALQAAPLSTLEGQPSKL